MPSAALADGPVDPMVPQAWHLASDGPLGIGSAWQQTTGGDVVVAILDSGADLQHPELAPNLWTNPGEIAGNGIDDDRDGGVDDVHGTDVVNRDGDPSDDNGHGTHVAGIIGARGGNGEGAAGIAWRVRLMPIKVLDNRATGNAEDVAAGLRYAVAHGARIVNVSLAGPRPSRALRDAIEAARRRGVLVVAAAGNAGQDLDSTPSYPVSLLEDNVLGVAATTPDGSLARVSNHGEAAELAAPGSDILSTARGGGYELRTGTSAAAPMVAGAAALVASLAPAADYRGLTAALQAGSHPTALPGGERQLDVGAAVRAALAGAAVAPPPPADRIVLGRAASARWSRPISSKQRLRARSRAARAARARLRR